MLDIDTAPHAGVEGVREISAPIGGALPTLRVVEHEIATQVHAVLLLEMILALLDRLPELLDLLGRALVR